MFRLAAGMRRMTGAARPSLIVPVDMEVMQVSTAVPKIGQRPGLLDLHGLWLMAGEAEIEFFPAITIHIETIRICISQESVMITAMRVVAAGAVFLPDRPMVIRVGLQQGIKACDGLAICGRSVLTMALQAKIHRLSYEIGCQGRCVRIMTVVAALLTAYRFMSVFHPEKVLWFGDAGFGMTINTELPNRCLQKCGTDIRAMGIMAGCTVLLYWWVHFQLSTSHFLFKLVMALVAKLN